MTHRVLNLVWGQDGPLNHVHVHDSTTFVSRIIVLINNPVPIGKLTVDMLTPSFANIAAVQNPNSRHCKPLALFQRRTTLWRYWKSLLNGQYAVL